MAQRATSLGPKPSLFLFVFLFLFFLGVFVFGSGEVAKGPPHLALNPPFFFAFVFFAFLSLF